MAINKQALLNEILTNPNRQKNPRASNDVLGCGDHCQCRTCNELFNSTAAFGRHRINGKCLTVEGMKTKGMVLSNSGWWITAIATQDFMSLKN